MSEMILALIGVALVQFLCVLLLDDPKQKSLLRFVGGVAAISVLLGSVRTLDFAAYAATLRDLQNRSEITDAAQSESRRLNRLFIEQECSAYIMNKAAAMNIELSDVIVSLSWNTDGYWYPSAVELTVSSPCDRRPIMEDWIQTNLGIPVSSQTWREEAADEV